jgi:NTE family protein
VLLVGAVDVLSGEFRVFDSRSDRISPATILASAAIPTLFRSVRLDGGTYWDGLFSQNPPISQLIDTGPDEIWVIQINPSRRESEPTTALEITDRRNELAGNLSLYQELRFVEKIDQLLEEGKLAAGSGYKSIMIRILELTRARVPHALGASSKLNRDPGFIRDLIAHGERQGEEFLTALAFEHAWRARDVEAIVSLLADDIELRSSAPFPDWGPTRDVASVAAFLRAHLGHLMVDVTRKQVARERIVWTLRTPPDASGSRGRGQAQVTLSEGRVDSLSLGPF